MGCSRSCHQTIGYLLQNVSQGQRLRDRLCFGGSSIRSARCPCSVSWFYPGSIHARSLGDPSGWSWVFPAVTGRNAVRPNPWTTWASLCFAFPRTGSGRGSRAAACRPIVVPTQRISDKAPHSETSRDGGGCMTSREGWNVETSPRQTFIQME